MQGRRRVSMFGDVASVQDGVSLEPSVSEDGRTMTLTFSDVVVELGNSPDDAALTASRALSLVVPLKGAPRRTEIEFAMQGSLEVSENAHASVLLSVNGQSTLADFGADSSTSSYLQPLHFIADTPAECRLLPCSCSGGTPAFPMQPPSPTSSRSTPRSCLGVRSGVTDVRHRAGAASPGRMHPNEAGRFSSYV